MTRRELRQLVDRIPECALTPDTGARLRPTSDDLRDLNAVVIELANQLGALTVDWMEAERRGIEAVERGVLGDQLSG
jgi:hypothetical protein